LHVGSHLVATGRDDGILLTPASGTTLPAPAVRRAVGAAAGGEPVAELAGVSKAYGSRSVFAGLDAVFRRGVLTAVTGRSGSGKSTMLAMLAGLERPDAGEVRVAQQPLSSLDRDGLAALRRGPVSYVSQEPGL